jgi:hypothetical protein
MRRTSAKNHRNKAPANLLRRLVAAAATKMSVFSEALLRKGSAGSGFQIFLECECLVLVRQATYVFASVAEHLKTHLGSNAVFYDTDYTAELARPNLDLRLQRIYHDNSDLIVVFLCTDYSAKEWCGLEWRAIRDIIKQREDAKVMLLRLDNEPDYGLFGIDGYIDISAWSPERTAEAIKKRLTA